MMKKFKFFILAVVAAGIVITGCAGAPAKQEPESSGQDGASEPFTAEETPQPVPDGPGVAYEALDPRDIRDVYDPLSQYACGSLHYDGRIYTSMPDLSELPEGEEEASEPLEHVYLNHGYTLSSNKEELAECTNEGEIYSVDGYDTKDLVCVIYTANLPEEYDEDGNITNAGETADYRQYFICLNGIRVEKGSDLFVDRLAPTQTGEIYWKPGTQKASQSGNKGKDSFVRLSQKKASDLLEKINQAKFLKTKRTSMGSDEDRMVSPSAGQLKIRDQNGLEYCFDVNKKGQIAYLSPEGTEFVLDMGAKWLKQMAAP